VDYLPASAKEAVIGLGEQACGEGRA